MMELGPLPGYRGHSYGHQVHWALLSNTCLSSKSYPVIHCRFFSAPTADSHSNASASPGHTRPALPGHYTPCYARPALPGRYRPCYARPALPGYNRLCKARQGHTRPQPAMTRQARPAYVSNLMTVHGVRTYQAGSARQINATIHNVQLSCVQALSGSQVLKLMSAKILCSLFL